MKNSIKMTSVALACMLATSALAVEDNNSEDQAKNTNRADWLRGSWGLNWKPVDVYNGKSENLTVDQLLEQIKDLKTLDYIQVHLGESSIKSSVHIAPLEILETLWQGDTDENGNPINLIVPRAASGVDPFLDIITKIRAAGFKIQVYINSSSMLRRVNSEAEDGYTPNPDYIPNITERWKELCDTDPEIQAYINSQSYHFDEAHSERPYLFAYAEFVLKKYSERYGELIDGWLFDTGEYMSHLGDNSTSGNADEQLLYKAVADAARAGNPNAAISFNNGPERETEELNPFSEATRHDDYMFGHPYNGGRNLGRHDNGLYDRNYAHIEKMIETNGNAHAGLDPNDWEWDDKVVAHFDPPMSTTSWNGGNTPALTDEEFILWNLQATQAGGAITWGVPLVKKSGLGDDLLIRDWAMSQLTLADQHLAEFQQPNQPNWARAHTELKDAAFVQAYSFSLVEGQDFWDPQGAAITLNLVEGDQGRPTWLTLQEDITNPGTWLLEGTPNELVEATYTFIVQAISSSGVAEREMQLTVGEVPSPYPLQNATSIVAMADTNYGDNVVATMTSDVQVAPDGLASFQVEFDVTPVMGNSIQSGESGGTTTSTSWGVDDAVFNGSDSESIESISGLRITNFQGDGSCLNAENITNLSLSALNIANGQSSNDRVMTVTNGVVNNLEGEKVSSNPGSIYLSDATTDAVTNLVIAVGNTSSKNKWSVNSVEVSYTITAPNVERLDFNCDKKVDVTDMALFIAALGSQRGDVNYLDEADFTNDGRIRFDDIKTLARELGLGNGHKGGHSHHKNGHKSKGLTFTHDKYFVKSDEYLAIEWLLRELHSQKNRSHKKNSHKEGSYEDDSGKSQDHHSGKTKSKTK
ncbi:hypothetical protein LMH66_04085 [Shewanella sp. 10N.7]|uniref:dockerin type I domain-containing protein n=1 Tax=Shewanella sp. 10N.7 TaxID=2885093 RepID=UPI001E41F29D|nr:dockerin type I domain-containing protein [Shewanella sp. 10N.7]MCC4831805.1 hypothetical protein [Shewanella sp. 10N.7]